MSNRKIVATRDEDTATLLMPKPMGSILLQFVVLPCASILVLGFALVLVLVGRGWWPVPVAVLLSAFYLVALYSTLHIWQNRPRLTLSNETLTRTLPSVWSRPRREISIHEIESLLRFEQGIPTVEEHFLPNRIFAVLSSGERVPITADEDGATSRSIAEWLIENLRERGCEVGQESRVVRMGLLPRIERRPFGCRFPECDPPDFRIGWFKFLIRSIGSRRLRIDDGFLIRDNLMLGSRKQRRWPLRDIRDVHALVEPRHVNSSQEEFCLTAVLRLEFNGGEVSDILTIPVSSYTEAENYAWIASVIRRHLPARGFPTPEI